MGNTASTLGDVRSSTLTDKGARASKQRKECAANIADDPARRSKRDKRSHSTNLAGARMSSLLTSLKRPIRRNRSKSPAYEPSSTVTRQSLDASDTATPGCLECACLTSQAIPMTTDSPDSSQHMCSTPPLLPVLSRTAALDVEEILCSENLAVTYDRSSNSTHEASSQTHSHIPSLEEASLMPLESSELLDTPVAHASSIEPQYDTRSYEVETLESSPSHGSEIVAPMPGEDQAAMLSRLLSVAAAATAASLVGNDNQALRDAREVALRHSPVHSDSTSAPTVDGSYDGVVDGSFDGFLAALQSGRLAQALRNGGNVMGGGPPVHDSDDQALNFFRMFRFSNSVSSQSDIANSGEALMVPIIIVGIRSVPINDSNQEVVDMPPFLDPSAHPQINSLEDDPAVSQAAAALGLAPNSDGPRAGRRSSLPELNAFPSLSIETPINRADHAVYASTNANTSLDLSDETPVIDQVMSRLRTVGNEQSPAQTSSQGHNRRPLSLSRPRSQPRTTSATSVGSHQTRSWIIYVLGGTYPEDHPILTTPSLFTDSPTYEDMLLLSTMIGPVKPEVANREDLIHAGPVFVLEESSRILAEHCLICLTDYQVGDTCRTLARCTHYFHQGCVDAWLTKGRNTCPCCRLKSGAKDEAIAQPTGASASAAMSS